MGPLSTLLLTLAVQSSGPLTDALDRGAEPWAVLVARGATWRYLDDGSDQGTAWRENGFDDGSWAAGRAELGYGDGDEATVVSFGSNPADKHVTTYFRHELHVSDPNLHHGLTLRILVDDGAVAYLNGFEVGRGNLPAGPITSATLASAAVVGADESDFSALWVDPSLLEVGSNVLAVEIHQVSPASSDISFDLELEAFVDGELARGPYLQLGTPHSVVVRWRTDVPQSSVVEYGTAPDQLTQVRTSWVHVRNHSIVLDGLHPDTTYHYAVGSSSGRLAEGPGYFFETPPLVGSTEPFRVWVLGDSGTANTISRAVRDAYSDFTGATHTDLWLMLGDNAYVIGSDAEVQAAVFDTYPEMLRKSVLWPTRGNHDWVEAGYFGAFTLPTAGEAGGMPSGTESYYSFDHGNAHFVCLDSFLSDRTVDGPMYAWLVSDLAAAQQDWLVAFWHHAPYTKGTHDSDLEQALIDMRSVFLPLLEGAGVDLVLCGHSHDYERSFLIDGHYGPSATFDPMHLVDGGDGRVGGGGAYRKADVAHAGTVYCVAGCSGKFGTGPLDHPAMFLSASTVGSLVLDFAGDRLDATFVRGDGLIEDTFTIEKTPASGLGASAATGPLAPPVPTGPDRDAGPPR